MSIVVLKKKSKVMYESNRSGREPGGIWLTQGPFGKFTFVQEESNISYGKKGFSINGGHRNKGGVGKDMKMSKSGTPYRGMYPIGNGGSYGMYPSATLIGDYIQHSTGSAPLINSNQVVEPVLNARCVAIMGTQSQYIKPSVLSTYGMLDKKYKCVKYGQYPNNWVQPNYTGNQVNTSSQSVYIGNKSSLHTRELKVNNIETYEGLDQKHGPTLCTQGRSTAGFKFNDMVRNAPYTKTLRQPVTYDTYNTFISRSCKNPVGSQKPFPFAVQTGKSQSATGSSITSFANSCHSNNIYLKPPVWYTQ